MSSGKETRTGQVVLPRLFFAMMFACVLYLAGQTACFASTVVLQWDPNTDADLAGYKVYYQADSSTQPFEGKGANEGDSPIDVGKDIPTATISGLDPTHSYYFAVTAYNTSGVESAYSNTVYVPELVPPTISITSPADNAIVSGPVSVTAEASDNSGVVTKVEFYVNGKLKATDTSSPYDYSWGTSAIPAGTYTLMTKAYDAAGNTKQSANVSVTLSKEQIAPMVKIISPIGNKTLSRIITVSAKASDNVGVKRVDFYVDGSLQITDTAPPWRFSLNTASLSNDTPHTLSAKAYDASANTGESLPVPVTVFNDKTAPTVSITSPAENAIVTGKVTVTGIAYDETKLSKVKFYINNVLKKTYLSHNLSKDFSYTWATTNVSDGPYTLTAKAIDAFGNEGLSSVTVSVKNDTKSPTVSITSPTDDAIVSGTVTVRAGASDNVKVSKVEFYVDNVLKHTDSTASYSYSWVTTALPNGSYTLTVKGYDSSGNVGQSSITATVGN